MKQFKIRCSAINDIMAKATKGRTISVGAETFCKKWLIRQMTGKHEQQVSTPVLRKGILMEDMAIDFLLRLDGGKSFFDKNEDNLQNEYLTGTPDIITEDTVIDIKCPWDAYTMPYFDTEPDKGYWAQLQGYMALTGRKKARLVYLLMDAPESLIESAEKKALWNGLDVDAVRDSMTFDNVPDNLRKVEFTFDYDEDYIASVYDRVTAMRDFLKALVP